MALRRRDWILVQSLFFSCLTLLLFYVMPKSLHGRHWALVLLAPIVLHEWLILEAPTGYRMNAYGFFCFYSGGLWTAPWARLETSEVDSSRGSRASFA
jgi:hypothetical protein